MIILYSAWVLHGSCIRVIVTICGRRRRRRRRGGKTSPEMTSRLTDPHCTDITKLIPGSRQHMTIVYSSHHTSGDRRPYVVCSKPVGTTGSTAQPGYIGTAHLARPGRLTFKAPVPRRKWINQQSVLTIQAVCPQAHCQHINTCLRKQHRGGRTFIKNKINFYTSFKILHVFIKTFFWRNT